MPLVRSSLTRKSYRLIRLFCGATSLIVLAVAIVVAVRGSARPVFGNQSLATGSALLLTVVAGVLLSAAACAGQERWDRWSLRLRAWRETSANLGTRTQFWSLLTMALACQLLLVARGIYSNTVAVNDQADYLRVAREIAELGGPTALPAALSSGSFREDNRHPLYVCLLAMRPTFGAGKTLSALFGVLLTVSASLIAYRHFGPLAGGVTASLLAVNGALLHSGSLVACETLLALLVLWSWNATLAGWHQRVPGALVLGVFWGLAYLTKASAFFLFVVAIAFTLLAPEGRRFRRCVLVGMLLGGFVLSAGALLVRNARTFGNPLHSFNSRLLFADSYDEGVALPDLGFRQNWHRYRGSHSVSESCRRFLDGLLMESFVLLRVLGPSPLDSGRALLGVGLLLSAMSLLLAGNQHGQAVRLLAGWVLVFWVFFGWYQPIAAGDRFLMPLVAPLLILASGAMTRTMAFWRSGKPAGSPLLAVAAAAFYSIAFTMATVLWG